MSLHEAITLSPALKVDDALAAYWLRQVTVRLRREVSWLRQQGNASYPYSDPAQDALDLQRFYQEKLRFFKTDPTARYLTDQLRSPPPSIIGQPKRGSFSWVVHNLALDDLASFVLALGLATSFDSAMGSVIAWCLRDVAQTQPTLALAQRLWEAPDRVLALVSVDHPLFRYGLFRSISAQANPLSDVDWQRPFAVPAGVAQLLLFPETPLPLGIRVLEPRADTVVADTTRLMAARLKAAANDTLRIIPVVGSDKNQRTEVVQELAYTSRRPVMTHVNDARLLQDEPYLSALMTLCWLKGVDLLINQEASSGTSPDKGKGFQLPLNSAPLTLYLGISERQPLAALPAAALLPVVPVPAFGYEDRVTYWQQCLGSKASGFESAIAECARRFRYGKTTIQAVCEGLKALPATLSEAELMAACQAEVALDVGDLAQRVSPRFGVEALVLPQKQAKQFSEVLKAMQSLTEVHYAWGTARAWSEGGIAVLFAGPPGTGKTMAAEVLATRLSLPMYRIDLSQVVNKYIGETEKNLKKLFDAADAADILLFFDEADALFGQRTEVKDAHDRYANLEISYLLERMERFKGLAILATNRKKDLDEAFLRRLRYVIDFPPPDEAERRRIWQKVIPETVDLANIDLGFLAKQFRLTGGHIHSIVLNACLQSASGGEPPFTLEMTDLIVAVKREYDKLNRPISLEHFGPYTKLVAQLEGSREAPSD